jgi:hypothetical protein
VGGSSPQGSGGRSAGSALAQPLLSWSLSFSSWSGLSVRCWDPPVLEHRQASRLKNEEKHKSENHIIATDFVPPKHTSKSVSKHATEIRLKNPYLLASKYDLAKIDVNITPCYAIVCKEVLFSLEDMPPSLPPAVP